VLKVGVRKIIQIDVWSDIVCPFCYIGKRNLETALASFPERNQVRVHWKSFELDPHRSKVSDQNIYQLLAEKYGRGLDWGRQMCEHTAKRAKEVGLNFHFDRVVPANTFDAHRLVHFADRHGLQVQAEERLMAAYFSEGQNLNDQLVLQALGEDIGLDAVETQSMFNSNAFAAEVRRDEQQAADLGIRGVPFFLFNREVPLSGAHSVDTFLATLASTIQTVD
jgi:predicted DsbA family dithiol-disulfide isomerase